jgi:hypothetical protein
MAKKGQASMEAMIAIGVLFVIFFVMFMFYNQKNIDLNNTEIELTAKSECFKLSLAINNIFSLGENSQITLNLKNNITVEPEQKRIESESATCTIITNQVSDQSVLTGQRFTLLEGDITLSNDNNIVVIQHE